MDTLKNILMALLNNTDLLDLAITAIVGLLAAKLYDWTGVQLSAARRATIESAIATGLASALRDGLTGEAAIKHTLAHVTGAGAGESVRKLKAPESALRAKIQASPIFDQLGKFAGH